MADVAITRWCHTPAAGDAGDRDEAPIARYTIEGTIDNKSFWARISMQFDGVSWDSPCDLQVDLSGGEHELNENPDEGGDILAAIDNNAELVAHIEAQIG